MDFPLPDEEEDFPNVDRTRGKDKAMNLLGRTISVEKVRDVLGITEEDVQLADARNYERESEAISRARAGAERKSKKENMKALDILGHNPSDAKAMQQLGLEQSEMEEAKNYREIYGLQKLERQRSLDSVRNKKDLQKALEVLGHDPSRDKIKRYFGLDEGIVQQAQLDNFERENERKRIRSYSAGRDKKASAKAFNVLGYNPSDIKTMAILGLDPVEISAAQAKRIQRMEDKLARERAQHGTKDKKTEAKALNVLGYDPSHEKAKRKFGVDDSTLLQALIQERMRVEEEIAKKRARCAAKDKKHATKALDMLGRDPSEEKVKEVLGLESCEVEEARIRNAAHFEEEMKRKRDLNSTPHNRKGAEKALDRLGHNPLDKAARNLGMTEDEVKEEKEAQLCREEQKFQRARSTSGPKDKKAHAKALKVLGEEISRNKIAQLLGIEATRTGHTWNFQSMSPAVTLVASALVVGASYLAYLLLKSKT